MATIRQQAIKNILQRYILAGKITLVEQLYLGKGSARQQIKTEIKRLSKT